ncbi:hypothetical protein MTO96_046202 [Rhipicephalus appendiculatus]
MQFRRDGTIVSEEELGGTPGYPEASHYAPEVVFESDSPLRMRSRLRSLGEVFLVASPPPPPLVAPFRFPSQAFLLGHPFPPLHYRRVWLRFTGSLSFRRRKEETLDFCSSTYVAQEHSSAASIVVLRSFSPRLCTGFFLRRSPSKGGMFSPRSVSASLAVTR